MTSYGKPHVFNLHSPSKDITGQVAIEVTNEITEVVGGVVSTFYFGKYITTEFAGKTFNAVDTPTGKLVAQQMDATKTVTLYTLHEGDVTGVMYDNVDAPSSDLSDEANKEIHKLLGTEPTRTDVLVEKAMNNLQNI